MTTPIDSTRLTTDPSILNSESEPERPPLSTRVLARRVDDVPRSGIRRFFDIMATMTDVISLGVGEPDFDTPEQVIEAGRHSLAARRTHYASNYGTIELRRALAHHIERLYGVRYDPSEEILITIGASEALDVTCRATLDPGDEVIVHEPSYVSYRPCIIFAGGVPVGVNTTIEEDFVVDPARIEAAITPRTKALLLNYPCNPTGAVLPHDVQDEIARIAVRHDLLVYSDEIYDRLTYGGYEMRTMSSLPGMRRRTVLIGGFSKAYAMTGWRIGYICAPSEILEGILKVHQYVIMSAPTVAQDAALEALKSGESDVRWMLSHYDRRRQLLVEGFNRIGLRTFEPQGAFYVFPDITSTGLTSDQFSEQLLRKESVAVVPGSAFGQAGEGHVRCCYATSEAEIKEAIVRIERFVKGLGKDS
jgi:aminotransferase